MSTKNRVSQLLGVDARDANAISVGLHSLLDNLGQKEINSLLVSNASAVMFEDFLGLGATLADNPNVLISQAGTPTAAAAITASAGNPAGHRGWVAGSVDNVDAEIDEVALGKLPWILTSSIPSGGFAVAEIGFVIPTALTARQYFFGFTDDETEGTGTNGSLNIQTGTTVVDVATDAVGFIFSSLATDADGYYAAETNGGTQALIGNTGLTGIVDAYTILRVELNAAGDAWLYGSVGSARGSTPALVGQSTTAVATTSLLLPLFAAAATTTTAVEWEIDYMLGSVG